LEVIVALEHARDDAKIGFEMGSFEPVSNPICFDHIVDAM